MKKLLFVILGLLSMSAYSQTGFKKMPKGTCSIDHKCSTEYKYDAFDKVTHYKYKSGGQGIAKSGYLGYELYKIVDNKGNFIITLTFLVQRIQCCTPYSYVHTLFKDGSDVKIPTSSKKVNCSTNAITVNITPYLDTFIEKEIDQVRVVMDFEANFTINDKGKEAFVKNLQCIKDASVKQD